MANADKILGFLEQIRPKAASNSEISRQTGVGPPQQVYQITRDLKAAGKIEGERRGREWQFWVGDRETDQNFERGKLLYEEDGRQMRALNDIMWRIPTLAMTLTGGLWFGISKIGPEQDLIKAGMFLLAAMGNIAFLVSLWRIRAGVMERYIQRMGRFAPLPSVDNPHCVPNFLVKSNYTVITLFSIMLAVGSVVSLIGACNIISGRFTGEIPAPVQPGKTPPKQPMVKPDADKPNRG